MIRRRRFSTVIFRRYRSSMSKARDSKKTKKNNLILTYALFFLLFGASSYAISFEEIIELETQGKIEEAIGGYRALLESQNDRFCEITIRAVGIISDIEEKRALMKQAIDVCTQPDERHKLLLLLAELEELVGDIVAAQKYYQMASFAIPNKKDFYSLISSAILLFELGELRSAEAQVRGIIETCRIEEVKTSADILLSRIYFASEREEKSLEIAYTLIEQTEIRPAALLWIFELATYLSKEGLRDRAYRILLEDYSQSPEAAIAAGHIELYPSPSVFMGPALEDIPVEEGTTELQPEPRHDSNGKKFAIQTGAYSVRENAEYAVSDLKEAGFTAVIREEVNGFFRVVIPDIDRNKVDGTIDQLADKGFDGIPVEE